MVFHKVINWAMKWLVTTHTFATHICSCLQKNEANFLGAWPFKLFTTTQVTSDASSACSTSQLPFPAERAIAHASVGDTCWQ